MFAGTLVAHEAHGGVQTFASGSLIIPMDTDTATTTGANHASFNQNSGMWKAYGLVYKLLQNGIPISWGIKAYPTKNFNDIDFTVTSVSDKRTATNLGSWDYRGGPFIIDAANVAAASPIISAWWAAKCSVVWRPPKSRGIRSGS